MFSVVMLVLDLFYITLPYVVQNLYEKLTIKKFNNCIRLR